MMRRPATPAAPAAAGAAAVSSRRQWRRPCYAAPGAPKVAGAALAVLYCVYWAVFLHPSDDLSAAGREVGRTGLLGFFSENYEHAVHAIRGGERDAANVAAVLAAVGAYGCAHDMPWPWDPAAETSLAEYRAELGRLAANHSVAADFEGAPYFGCLRGLPIARPMPLTREDRPHEHWRSQLRHYAAVDQWVSCEVAYAEREINVFDYQAQAFYPTCDEGVSSKAAALSTVPAWFYINLDRVEERAKGKALERALVRHGLPASRVTRINAITPEDVRDNMMVSLPRHHKKRLVGARGASTELALSISHLFAIKAAYDSGVPYAVISEDDVSFEYEPFWRRRGADTSFAAVVQNLEHEHPAWEILQTSITVTMPNFDSKMEFLVKAFYEHGGMPTKRAYHTFGELWSTVAYVIHRRGMMRLLDRYWPGGLEHGLSPKDVLAGKQFTAKFQREHWDRVSFQFHGASPVIDDPPVSDILVFSAEAYDHPNHTFFTPRPLFTSATDASHHHTNQLMAHSKSKEAIRRVMYGV
jgi:GR25 family glycosyltransferase involved in LPS biosynthesis